MKEDLFLSILKNGGEEFLHIGPKLLPVFGAFDSGYGIVCFKLDNEREGTEFNGRRKYASKVAEINHTIKCDESAIIFRCPLT